MDVTLLQTPYDVAFSGNPMPFSLAISPYGSQERNMDIRLSIRVMIEQTYGSNSFIEASSETCYPDNDGLITIDVSTIVQPYLTYYVPRLGITKPLACTNQYKRYKIAYLLSSNAQVIGTLQESSLLTAIKGGMGLEYWHPTEFFTDAIVTQKKPLHFPAAGEKSSLEEYRFMYWIYPFTGNDAQTVRFTLTWDNGSTTVYDLIDTISVPQWNVCCTPIGVPQVLQTILNNNPTLTLVSYTVSVLTNITNIVSPVIYIIDYRNFYRTYQLFYRTSVGGLETLRMRSQTDMETEYTRQQAQRVLPPSYFTNTLQKAQNIETAVFETRKFSGVTGFLSRPAGEKLLDFFVSKDRFEMSDGKLLPIIVLSKTSKFFSNKENLISIQVDWQRAYLNQYYTPKQLMPLSRTCPGLLNFVVKQVSQNILQIMYACPAPYDYVQVEITVNGIVTTVYFSGNTKIVRQQFTNPLTSGSGTITVVGRVVCDKDVAPMDMGAASTVSLTIHAASNLIATDDTYAVAAGYNSAVQLVGSVLANDYDPDGTVTPTVISAGGSTNAGGTYSINTSGIVTYTPPSSVYNGRDYFQYTITDGASRQATAKVYLNVGSAPSGVFAKIVGKNITGSSNGSGSTISSGEIWIGFFGDPFGTQPLDITSLALTVNYRQLERSQDHNTGAQTTNQSDLTVNPSGTEVKIYEGTLYSSYYDLSWTYSEDYSIDFTVLAGTGYVAI